MDLNNIDWSGIVCAIALIVMVIMVTNTMNKVTPNKNSKY